MHDYGSKASEEIKSKMEILQDNVSNIKARYEDVNKSLHDVTIEKKQLELRVETLEEDNAALNITIKEGLLAQPQNPGERNKYASMTYHSSGRRINRKEDSKRKGENLRKALIDKDEDEDGGLDLDQLFHSTSTFARVINYLLQFIPFKNDIRQIQAKHGASVASYFVFSRFIFLQYTVVSIAVASKL